MATQIAKVIEISASSAKGFEDAISTGVKRVAKTVKNIRGAWVNEMRVVTDANGKVTEWRVNMRVSFLVE
jgi:dodecin